MAHKGPRRFVPDSEWADHTTFVIPNSKIGLWINSAIEWSSLVFLSICLRATWWLKTSIFRSQQVLLSTEIEPSRETLFHETPAPTRLLNLLRKCIWSCFQFGDHYINVMCQTSKPTCLVSNWSQFSVGTKRTTKFTS